MKNKVLSFFALLSIGTVSVQPLTKADLKKVMNISGIIATTPNIVQLVNGTEDKHLATLGNMSQATYNFTSAALESGTAIEQFDRFVLAIINNKRIPAPVAGNQPQGTAPAPKIQGNILEWDKAAATVVAVALAGQFVKELCNEVAGRFISLNDNRILRRIARTVCASSIEGGVDALQALIDNKILKAEQKDILQTFTTNFLATLAAVATNQIVGEMLIEECEDDDRSFNTSIKDILSCGYGTTDNTEVQN